MQPVRGPVRRDVTAVAPDRPLLHAAHRLPDVLSGLDVARPDEDQVPPWSRTRAGIGGAI